MPIITRFSESCIHLVSFRAGLRFFILICEVCTVLVPIFLGDNEFWQEVVKLGGIPDELRNHPELIEFYTPILKADFSVIENYRYEKKQKLTIPIDVFYGSEEAQVNEMLGWKEESTEKVTINQMEGNHFFIFDHTDFFISYFKNIKRTVQ